MNAAPQLVKLTFQHTGEFLHRRSRLWRKERDEGFAVWKGDTLDAQLGLFECTR